MMMRLQHTGHIDAQEPYEETYTANRFHPAHDVLVTYRSHEYRLKSGHGTQDHVYTYRAGTTLYVLAVNYRLPYVGIARYDLSDRTQPLEPAQEAFWQESQVAEDLGATWEDVRTSTLCRRAAYILAELD